MMNNKKQNALTISQLEKRFGDFKALKGVTFDLRQGEILGFLGPNGAGKSTTIRSIMGFSKYDAGEIAYFDRGVLSRPDTETQKNIAYAGADTGLYGDMSAAEHIRLVSGLRAVDQKDISTLVDMFGLDTKKRVEDLSSGNKQKLQLILALMSRAPITILDEPTTALDPLMQETLYKFLKQHRDAGNSILMSSHNLAEVQKVCDRVAVIRQGEIVAIEDIADIKAKRLYLIRVEFNKLPESLVNKIKVIKGVTLEKTKDNSLAIKVKGDIQEILRLLAPEQIRDIEVTHSPLEDLFMEYYINV